MNKNILRGHAKKLRAQMLKTGAIDDCSRKITAKILNSEDFKNARHIALYYPIRGEIDITPIINTKDKFFYFPRCVGQNLEFVKYEKNCFIEGAFSIPEPKGDKIDPEILDIIYTPALLANKKGYRLGWGKGYYDRFFKKIKRAKKVIVAASYFVCEKEFEEEYDVACDYLICE